MSMPSALRSSEASPADAQEGRLARPSRQGRPIAMPRWTAPISCSFSSRRRRGLLGCATRQSAPLRGDRPGHDRSSGLAKAIRTVPVIPELAKAVDRQAAARHWIVDFTNPVGIVTQALIDGGHRALGLCNVAIGMQRWLAGWLELSRSGQPRARRPKSPELGAGRAGGRSRRPPRPAGGRRRTRSPITPDCRWTWFGPWAAIPLLPALLLPDRHGRAGTAGRAHSGEGRGWTSSAGSSRCIAVRRSRRSRRCSASGGGAYYSEAAVDLIASLHDGRSDVQVVDVRIDGRCPTCRPMP